MKSKLSICIQYCSIGMLSIFSNLSAEVIGIIGGGSQPSPYVALINDSITATPVPLSNTISINSVAMNPSGISAIGGSTGNLNYGAFVNPSGTITPFSNNGAHNLTAYFSIAINSSEESVAAGQILGVPYSVKADLNTATDITGFPLSCAPPSGAGSLNGAAINDLGLAIIGGHPGQNPGLGIQLALIPPNSTVAQEILCLSTNGDIFSVAINNSGNSIAGGYLMNTRYANLFDSSGTSIATVPFPAGGQIHSVSIADSGTSLVGGFDAANGAYAALVDSVGGLHTLSGDPLPATGTILSVSIKDGTGCGNAIIGGRDNGTNSAYAALVDSSGKIHNIAGLPSGPGASINSVSINAFGTALIGGTSNGTDAYAAVVSSFGELFPLNISGPPIRSVSIRTFGLGPIPTQNLTGNNLIFADYINKYAPEKAFYFCPSLFLGKLAEALQAAAPTRNALSLFAADNNLFFLNHSLSVHLRNHRHFQNQADFSDLYCDSSLKLRRKNRYLAESSITKQTHPTQADLAESEESFEEPATKFSNIDRQLPQDPSYTLWFDAMGAFASQQEQNQTVGFSPSMGGFILGFERIFNKTGEVGGGAAYTFTHIHENENSGQSKINQEYLFLYATWANQYFYLDGALWAGIFQIHQARHIQITGFDFWSFSNTEGFQLSPHLEFGYEKQKHFYSSQLFYLTIDPFVMVDWANNWQNQYEETGDGPFNAGQRAHYSSLLRTETGFRFYETFSFNFWRLILEEKGSYAYKKPFKIGTVNSFLVGSPGSFTVETLSSSQHLGIAEMALIFEPINHLYPYGSISYQGEFSQEYQSHQINLEVSWDF